MLLALDHETLTSFASGLPKAVRGSAGSAGARGRLPRLALLLGTAPHWAPHKDATSLQDPEVQEFAVCVWNKSEEKGWAGVVARQ